MTRPLLALTSGLMAAWGLSIYPALRLGGPKLLVGSIAGALLALLPAVVVWAWNELAPPTTPEGWLRRLVLAMGVRMGLVLGGGLALYLVVPALHVTTFWIWILIYYLIALALETALLARPAPRTQSLDEAMLPRS